MLDGEIDALKEIIKGKQNEINRMVEVNHDKSKEIENLKENIKSLRVDNGAIQIFSNQNLSILKKYEESEANLVEAQKIATKAVDELNHYKQIYDEKSRSVAELEVSITATERDLSNKLDAERERTSTLQDELMKYKKNLEKTEMELYFVKETSRDQIMRSRQSAYENMHKADTMAIGLRKVEDTKEQLSQSLNLESFRANLLHDRLNNALETLDESQNMLLAVVEKSDDAHNINRVQERRLKKENHAIAQKLGDAQEVIKILAARTAELEQYMLERSSRDAETFFSSNEEFQTGESIVQSSIVLQQSKDCTMSLEKMNLHDDAIHIAMEETTTDVNTNTVQDPNSIASQSLVDNVTQSSNPQYHGKRCLLAKHMRNVVMLHNSLSIPENVRSSILDFSRCALTDDDVVQLVDWMRLMTLSNVQTIDFRSNLLTTHGVLSFCTYLLALSGDEYKRDSAVSVLFEHNQVLY